MKRRHVLYVCDALETLTAGGLVAARRLIEALGPHHDVLTMGVGGMVPLEAVRVPLFDGLVRKNGFVFAHPDDEAIRRALAWADVVHLQFPTALSFRVLRWARSMGVPVVAAHHVQAENLLRNVGLDVPWVARWLRRCAVRHFFSRATAVVCPTRFAKRELTNAGLTRPVHVVSNGVPPRFVPGATRVPLDLFTIISVGRHSAEKRHAVLVDAALRMKHRARVELVLSGKGPLTEALRRRAAALAPHVRIGFLEDDALLELTQRADLMVHPSEVELEGLAVAEALACGTPSMVCDAPTNAAVELALDERFIFQASNVDDLARRLDGWVEQREALAALRGAHAERGARMSLAASAATVAALYDELSSQAVRAWTLGAMTAAARAAERLALSPG